MLLRHTQGTKQKMFLTIKSGSYDVDPGGERDGGGGSPGRTGLARNREFFAFLSEKQASDGQMSAVPSRFDHYLSGLDSRHGRFLLLRKTGN
jgi:hypothetical protein